MSFHGYDDRKKNREEEETALEEFLANGGKVTKVPNSKTVTKLRRSEAASRRALEKNGITIIEDLADF